MVIVPDSDIVLIKSPLKLDNYNQITFNNANDQYNYFNSLTTLRYDDCTYQRKDGVIRFNTDKDDNPNAPRFEDLIKFNYCMYKNESYSNKWFYAFIKSVRYINDGMTEIEIETDVFQTWQFDIIYKNSFIEREHVSNDTIGLHTIPENLELGEYISNGFVRDNELSSLVYIVQVTEWIDGTKLHSTNFGGVACAGGAYICDSPAVVANIIQAFDNAGKGEAVLNVYVVPSKIVNNTSGSSQYSGQNSPVTYNIEIDKQTTLNGYSPKNNKVLTYPYNFLVIDNNNGSSNILHYEDFSTEKCVFEVTGVPTTGGSIKCVPKDYKGETRYQQEGLMAGKFPTCSWVNDLYTNWATQNAVNIGLGLVSDGLSVVSGLASKSGENVSSGLLGIGSTLGQIYQHSIIPNSAKGNINGGDINTCYNMNKFYFIKMSIKQEYARIIDNFFTMYGYKVNRLASPNINKRSNWDYMKCIDVNLEGDIPESDLDKIRNIFNNGCTFWHTTTYYLDYSQTNSIR